MEWYLRRFNPICDRWRGHRYNGLNTDVRIIYSPACSCKRYPAEYVVNGLKLLSVTDNGTLVSTVMATFLSHCNVDIKISLPSRSSRVVYSTVLTSIQSAGVAPEVNLRITQARNPILWNQDRHYMKSKTEIPVTPLSWGQIKTKSPLGCLSVVY